jgi:nicotinamidase-related amidase
MIELKSVLGKSALVVIDIQKGIVALGKLEPNSPAEVVANVSKLVSKFREMGLPVFLVHVGFIDGKEVLHPMLDQPPQWGSGSARPADWMDFVDEIKPTQRDIVITKRQWGAFYGTELDLQLRRRKIETIVLCGVSTNMGVETTARDAHQYGYNQVFATDAMAANSKDEHEASIKHVFPKIGLLRTTSEIISAMT